MLNANFENKDADNWFFFYAGYSFEKKRAHAYIWSGDEEYKASAEA